MRRGWIFGAVMLALATPALPADDGAAAKDTTNPKIGPKQPPNDRRRVIDQIAAQRRALAERLESLQGVTLEAVRPTIRAGGPRVAGRPISITDGIAGAGVAAASPAGDVIGPVGEQAGPGRSPEAAGDVYAFSPHNGRGSSRRFLNDPAQSGDYYALRFFPSQLARELPFQVDGLYFLQDDFYSWSPNWRLSVVTESVAMPFFPDPAAVVAPAIVFNTGTLFPRNTSGRTQTENAYVDFPSDPVYPSTAQFAIEDGAMSDQFNRADEVLGDDLNWFQCSATECFGAPTLNVSGNAVAKTGAGTALGWRLPDFGAGPTDCGAFGTCVRYVHDYIDDSLLQFFVPDRDVRLSLDFDLTSGTAAGVFARANLDQLQTTLPLFDYYLVWVQKAVGAVPSTLNIASSDGTALVTPQNLPAGSTIGSLTVDISGYSTVTIRAQVGANPALVATDSTRRYQGDAAIEDFNFGNIYGIAFPNATGGERVDNFRTRRHADLFALVQFPVGESVSLWADAEEEGREYFNTFYSLNGGTTWTQSGIVNDPDCLKVRNTMVALRVKDGSPSVDELFQVNETVSSLFLPCCTCTRADAFDCSGLSLDDYCLYCATPPPVAGDCSSQTRPTVRPVYEPNLPIGIIPKIINDRAPTLPPGAAAGATMWMLYVACDLNPTAPPCTLGASNAGVYVFDLGTDLCNGNQIPGLNDSTRTDYPCLDPTITRPDGPLYLYLSGITFTPTALTDYAIDIIELYDLNADCCADGLENLRIGGASCPAACTPVANPDDYLPNNFVRRIITVGGCTQGTNSIRKNTLAITKDAACPANELLAFWVGNDLSAGYNLHEIVGVANKSTIANPFANTPLRSDIRLPDECFVPSLAGTPGVAYYGCFWRDNCSGASVADP